MASNKTEKLKQEILLKGNTPNHVAIIMDGNGRWAKKRGLPRVAGHKMGVNSVHDIVGVCPEIGVKVLTLYTFSAENWNRPKAEISALMTLLVRTIRKEIEELFKNNVKINILGVLSELPKAAQKSMKEAMEKTKNNTGLILNLALNYSGRIEITEMVKKISMNVKDEKINIKDINEELISDCLYTSGLQDPDLLIRTSGVYRISNFLLWQLAYTEIYIINTLWPDFKVNEFYQAVIDYQNRERRFGMVSEQVNKISHPKKSSTF